MVIEQFTEQMRADGRALTEVLHDAGLRLSSVFWFYFEEANQWRFVFVSPLVDELGPKKVYQQVQKLLSRTNLVFRTINLTNIVAVPAKAPLEQFLQTPAGIAFKNNHDRTSHLSSEEQFIGNAYVYRVGR